MKFLSLIEKLLTLTFWFIVALGFGSAGAAILTLLAALIHEGGHIFAAYLFARGGVSMPEVSLSGFRITKGSLSYREELFVALGGPVLNLGLAFALYLIPVAGVVGEYARLFGFINFLSAVSNLLPCPTFDGYRAIECALLMKMKDPGRAGEVLFHLSFAFCAIAAFLSYYLLLKSGEGYWITGVFTCTIFSAMAARQKKHVLRENERF